MRKIGRLTRLIDIRLPISTIACQVKPESTWYQNQSRDPMSTTDKINLLNLNRAGLETFFVEMGEKPFRAKQLMQWVHQRGVVDFSKMTDISKSLRETLGR
ncbi:MAG: hypothetical protein O6703_03740, partial [Gammaproteobacteria bacterium]|nr:hypothetical protein [Gammaproteobacteria bacterium]